MSEKYKTFIKDGKWLGLIEFQPSSIVKKRLKWIVDNNKSTTLSLMAMREIIDDHWVGGTEPLDYAPYTSDSRVNYFYHIFQLKKKVGMYFRNFDFVLDYESGYPCICDMFFKMGFSGNYWFVSGMDKDIIGFSSYYLNEVRGGKACKVVRLLGDINIPTITNSLFISVYGYSDKPSSVKYLDKQYFSKFKILFFVYDHLLSGTKEFFADIQKEFDDYNWISWNCDDDIDVETKRDNYYLCGVRK